MKYAVSGIISESTKDMEHNKLYDMIQKQEERIVLSHHRSGGKMTAAVQWVRANPNGKILVVDQARKQALVRDYNLLESQVLTIEEYNAESQ